MRTLFIHPYDPTTDFCNEIYDQYRGMDNVGIIETNNISSSALRSQIREYDRIVFIGHGCEYGLMDRSLKRLLISSSDLQFFRDKEVVCIWCNANIFAEKYNLNAFATGMFISEPSEAVHYHIPFDDNLINESNSLFCRVLSGCIFDNVQTIRETVDKEYRSTSNPIVQFNRECMGFEN